MEPSDLQPLMALIKALLKERGISYRLLAQKLSLSESGVKKIFSASDVSFLRLNQLAGILGTRLIDLLDEVHKSDPRRVSFSQKQQEAFLAEPALFNLFYMLAIERVELQTIKNWEKPGQRELFRLLRKLDGLRLIRLLPGDVVKVPSLQLVQDFGGGPFMEKLYRDWGTRLVRELASPGQQASGKFMVRCVRMRDSTFQEFVAQLRQLDIEFTRRAIRETGVAGEALRPMKWISLTDQSGFIDHI